jgi:hypothetical protein
MEEERTATRSLGLEQAHEVRLTEAESAHCSDRVWPAAETMLAHMRGEDLRGAAILELGAGTGPCGISAGCPPRVCHFERPSWVLADACLPRSVSGRMCRVGWLEDRGRHLVCVCHMHRPPVVPGAAREEYPRKS